MTREKIVNILRIMSFVSCIVCIIYMIFVGGLVTYFLIEGVKFGSLSGFRSMIYAAICVLSFTATVNIAYVVLRSEESTTRRR